jgi:hypothetical protein
MRKILLLGLLALVGYSLAGCAVYVPEHPHYYGRVAYYEPPPVVYVEHDRGWHHW